MRMVTNRINVFVSLPMKSLDALTLQKQLDATIWLGVSIARLNPTTCRIGPAVNKLPRDKQIDIIAALAEGMSIRSVERLTGIHRDTIMRLGARVARGRAELHDRMMVGLRVSSSATAK
jgi:hypothetical protein